MYQVFLSEWQPIAGRMDTSVIWECEDAKEAYEMEDAYRKVYGCDGIIKDVYTKEV